MTMSFFAVMKISTFILRHLVSMSLITLFWRKCKVGTLETPDRLFVDWVVWLVCRMNYFHSFWGIAVKLDTHHQVSQHTFVQLASWSSYLSMDGYVLQGCLITITDSCHCIGGTFVYWMGFALSQSYIIVM